MKRHLKSLKNKKVAILACDGFEETELSLPRKALQKAGAITHIISPQKKKIMGWRHGKWTKPYAVDINLENADPKIYDALVLPGGVINPDLLRTHKAAVRFINHFFKKKKPIAAICHGPLTLIETGNLKGRTLTAYRSIKTDLINAGAHWQNKKVVIDKNLITSRQPSDLEAFNNAMINTIEQFSN